jgi:uncharacterized integral membrane protein
MTLISKVPARATSSSIGYVLFVVLVLLLILLLLIITKHNTNTPDAPIFNEEEGAASLPVTCDIMQKVLC